MKLIRYGAIGLEKPAVLTPSADGRTQAYDLSPLTEDIDGAFLADDGIGRARSALSAGQLPPLELSGQRIGAPIARPSAVVCVGMNYAAHATESGSEPPLAPIIFLKTPNTVAGPDDEAFIPPGSTRTDWEVELGVVIGARAAYLPSPAQSRAHIAGYLAANDLSERTFQLEDSGGQWSKGKCCPGFSPLGPWLVPASDVDADNLRLRSWVNGNLRQDSTTADMIFGVDTLIHHLSHYLTLEPGDVILTGTPQGVALSGKYPYLRPGDTIEIEIEGLGRQHQTFKQG